MEAQGNWLNISVSVKNVPHSADEKEAKESGMNSSECPFFIPLKHPGIRTKKQQSVNFN